MSRRRWAGGCVAALLLAAALPIGGCARGGEQEPVVPETVLDLVVTYAAAVEDAFYYYVALDTDGDFGADGPLPVAAGPNWGNGWGTGSLTHYVEYHQGRYELFRATLEPDLIAAGGGIVGVAGTPDTSDAGVHAITIDSLSLGQAMVTGDGAIASVSNASFQAAGTLSIETDAAGRTVADSVSWTPADDGGRPLTSQEQAQIDVLNAGGVQLAADSLSELGLALTLNTGGDLSGVQTITVQQTTAQVTGVFTPEGLGAGRTTQSTLPANNDDTLAAGPIPGMTIRTQDLVVAESARIRLLPNAVGESLGFPYESTLPQGGRTLRVTLDLAQLGEGVDDVSINFISTAELIFDPTVVNPDENTYDGLGRLGNDFFTILTSEVQTISDGEGLVEEESGDPTLEGPHPQEARNAVDVVDWRVMVRRLR
ncbi:MAG: hypothetical protein U9R79_03810 [Armatimonadota bacterium]|nr:hypothetical protein [Armatimonadota bacterium]